MTEATAPPDGQFQFPVLQRVLTTYFPGPDQDEDHSREFVARYLRLGEGTIEFRGLKAELESAINQYPKVAATEVNFALGTSLPSRDVRRHLMNLYDQITETGTFDREKAKAERPKGGDLLRMYFLVPVKIPARVARLRYIPDRVPIGAVFCVGLVLLMTGNMLRRVLPSSVHSLTNILTAIGMVVTGLTVWVMFALRHSALHPAEQREDEDTDEDDEDDEARSSRRPKTLRDRLAKWTRFRR